MEITLAQVQPLIEMIWFGKKPHTPFMHSSPAIGKSSVGRQLAKKHNLKFIDLRLTDMDPADFNGLPGFSEGVARFIPFDTFPTENTPIPEGYNGWLVMMDEMNSASESVQAAAYKFVLDHMVGQTKLHPKLYKLAAGNLETDNAIVNPMSTALISRFSHFYLRYDHEAWMSWAAGKIDIRLYSFFGRFPKHAYNFIPDATGPYSCPRSIEMLSDAIMDNRVNEMHRPLIASYLGEGPTNEFLAFLQLYKELPSFEEIMADPLGHKPSDNMSIRWATMGLVTHNITMDNAHLCEQHLRQYAPELQVCALRDIKARNINILNAKLRDWRLALSNQIM